MNILLVLIDSLNRRAISPYGPSPFATPNLQRFADRAFRFDNHFVGSLPCMPARREIFSGNMGFQWRPWGPLEPFDARLPRLLERAGYQTGIVTDHYHYWEESANGYIQSFDSAEFIRGHELDFWKPLLPARGLPEWVALVEKWRPGYGQRYFSNVADFRREEDFFPAKVMTAACDWLKARRQEAPFFLQVESFDVHEPFDAPEPYASMYGKAEDRNRFTLWPPYQDAARQADFLAQSSPEELAFIRSQYGAKVTMVDHWFGTLLDELDRQDLWRDTMVIVTTDHGHDLADRPGHGFGKQFPHFDSHANIPLMIWHPDLAGSGNGLAGLTTTMDLFATILDGAGAPQPPGTRSRSVLPQMRGAGGRDAVIYGIFEQGLCCTDGEWTLIQPPDRTRPIYAYSTMVPTTITDKAIGHGLYIPEVAIPQWQIPVTADKPTDRRPQDSEVMLFHRASDPGQTENLVLREPAQADRMRALMGRTLAAQGAPDELFARLGLDRGQA